MATVQKIVPHLWFDRNAAEAVDFYCSVFNDARTLRTSHYTEEGFEVHRMPAGTVMTIGFELEGQQFMALNGGPVFRFNEAISFVINCDSQEEIDYYWGKLSEGGDPAAQQCGWLKDKFGVSWQIVPRLLAALLDEEEEEEKVSRVMHVLLQMKKPDIVLLTEAAEGAKEMPLV